jgi:uncharacterized protein with von Willebrand factor type A (vWA) domain
MIPFDGKAHEAISGLKNVRKALWGAIYAGGSTDFGAAIKAANAMSPEAIVMITDGKDQYEPSKLPEDRRPHAPMHVLQVGGDHLGLRSVSHRFYDVTAK